MTKSQKKRDRRSRHNTNRNNRNKKRNNINNHENRIINAAILGSTNPRSGDQIVFAGQCPWQSEDVGNAPQDNPVTHWVGKIPFYKYLGAISRLLHRRW
jgi:hypothetical protein